MKLKNYHLCYPNLFIFLCFLGLIATDLSGQTVQTFTYTGATQTFVVPPCVPSITIDARGAAGGLGGKFNTSTAIASTGGNGGRLVAVLPVTAGQTLYINVGGAGVSGSHTSGGAGGFNGGGLGRNSTGSGGGGGGGGASDIRLNGIALTNRLIVAAGGGGGGGSGSASSLGGNGGNGGGTTGTAGAAGSSAYGVGGGGGTQTAGGAFGGNQIGATAGVLGIGGDGSGVLSNGSGGGGGGGYYGGGGGGTNLCSNCTTSSGAGGGGSSYADPSATSVVNTAGFQTGDGIITFSYNFNGAGVSASASSNSICSGATVTLTASNVLSYTWTPGGSNATNITDAPAATTSYTVQGTNSFGCISTAVLTVTVDQGVPTLTVANSANAGGICPFSTATLTASGATSYTWAGGTSVINGVSFSPSAASDYTVSGQNACGISTAVTSISVHPIPVVNASASSSSLCSGASLTLSASGNYTNHTWAGGFSSGVGFFPTATNTYVATGTSSLGCTHTAAVIVTVVTTPVIPPTVSSASICAGNSTTLSAFGATNYTWLPVNLNASSITVSPATTTTYTVIKSNANCVDTKTIEVYVHQLPNPFAIVTPTVVCALKTATLFGGGAQTFTWTAANFTTTGLSPLVAPNVPTTYTVTGSDGTCTNTTTIFLAVDPNPTLTASANPSVICLGQTTTLTPTGGVNYTWTATTGTVYTAVHTDNPTQPTLYTLTGDNAFGCTSSVNQIVLVNQLPPVTIAGTPTLVCVGGNAKLTAGGANSYQWDAGAGGVTTATAQVNPQTTTSYTVEGTNSATGCKNQKSITITVFEPSVAVSSPTSTCYGGLMNIVASGATSYTWHLGGGVTIVSANAAVTPTVFTIYTVTALTSTIGGLSCPSTNTTSIDIFYNPTITATSDRPSICKNESVNLFGNGGSTYSWNDPQSQNGATITVTPQLQTTYTVTGTDSNGCVSTGTVLIKVSPCVGIGELDSSNSGIVVYPNPNTGQFTIRSGVDINLTLSNELGQVIRTFELTASNNHKLPVADLAKGIYFITGQKDHVTIHQKIVVTK